MGSLSENVAIVTVTKAGTLLGDSVARLMDGCALYVPLKFLPIVKSKAAGYERPLKGLVAKLFEQYQYLIFIISISALVRLIAPYIKNKHADPAVVAVDDQGEFVVPILSSHLGGANELARKLASLIHAAPVITTASDVAGFFSVDTLGKEYRWVLDSSDENVRHVSAALVNGEHVGIYVDSTLRSLDWEDKLPSTATIFDKLESLANSDVSAAIIISDRIIDPQYSSLLERSVVYRPKTLVLGIGMRNSASFNDIEDLILRAFKDNGLSIKSVRNIATIDMRRGHEGLQAFSENYHVPIDSYNSDELASITPIHPSSFVREHLGIAGVCEPAAMLSAKTSSLCVAKTSSDNVSLAVSRVNLV